MRWAAVVGGVLIVWSIAFLVLPVEWFFVYVSWTCCMVTWGNVIRVRRCIREWRELMRQDKEVLAAMHQMSEHIAKEIQEHGTIHVHGREMPSRN